MLMNKFIAELDNHLSRLIEDTKEPWEKENPAKKHHHLTPDQKRRAKARAKAAGRPYPNLVDNMAVMKESFDDEHIAEEAPELYHATYRPYLKDIMKFGLGGKKTRKNWEDSKSGVIYLANDLNVAESYAETSEVVPDSYIDQIIVLKIDMDKIDKNKLTSDGNVADGTDTFEYHGVIPPEAITIAKQ